MQGKWIVGIRFLCVVVVFCLCLPGAAARSQEPYLHREGSLLKLGNAHVEMSLDASSGFVSDLFNKQTGLHNKLPDTGAWPFGLELGYPPDKSEEPVYVYFGGGRRLATPEEAARMSKARQLRAEIRADHVQQMHYTSWQEAGERCLQMEYADLKVNASGASTGVSLHVQIRLPTQADYFLITCRLSNNGTAPITSFYAGRGGILTTGSTPEEETFVAAPHVYPQPRNGKYGEKLFGYTAWGGPGVNLGWMDYSGKQGGVGIGYVNRAGYAMLFETSAQGPGMSLGWRMFRNEEANYPFAALLNKRGEHQIYPLNPGESFNSGEWIVALHQGDWHRTADIYRERYHQAFGGDRLTWETMSPALKKCDIFLYYTATKGDWKADEKRFVNVGVATPFAKMKETFEQEIKRVQLDPKQILAIFARTNTWGAVPVDLRYPDFFPVSYEAGGNDACKKAVQQLKQELGVPVVGTTLHIGFDHPDAVNYVPEADFAGVSVNPFYSFLGHSACLDNEPWFHLWKDKLIPGLASLGFTAVEFDEGAGNPTYCERPEHTHGASSLGILSQGMRSHDRIYKEFRAQMGPEAFFMCEGGNDQIARYIDLWEFGGDQAYEIERYTHPEHLVLTFASKEQVLKAFVDGVIPVLSPGTSEGPHLNDIRQLARLRKELREKQAPGFPQGFRDTVGLTVGDPDLIARAYTDGKGVTLAYYARKPVHSWIMVDGAALGIPKLGQKKVEIQIEAQQAGYHILTP